MNQCRLYMLVTLTALFCCGGPVLSAEKKTSPVDFDRDIKPILTRRCYRCHGPDKHRSGLRLDQRGSLLKGGDSGEPAILPGRGGDSYLIHLVSGKHKKIVMPPTGKRLSGKEIALLKTWIDLGAKWSGGKTGEEKIALTTKHWCFQPVAQVAPPKMAHPWIKTPIDAFILQKLQQKTLQPAPRADRRTLIRRLYFDMLGLPPTPEQVQRFVEDRRPDAWQRLVDEVLASPRYGERWAQHWLDVVRYADTHGFEVNTPRDNAWPYRDYVIRAFNEDKPYDRFVFEQIAGDTVGAGEATGFLVAGPQDQVKSPDPVLTKQQRQNELNEIIMATSGTFLGLTVGCARCHNHKFDPILQKDYYGLQAVFAGVQYGNRPLPREKGKAQQRLAAAREKLAAVREKLQREFGFREPVNSRRNVENFAPVSAKYIRFTIEATNNGIEPCIDELEIWSAQGKSPSRNVALASAGARPSSSGNYPDNTRHKLEHINDGHYGNERSWISNQNGKGWVQITLLEAVEIERIVWGRDRNQKYQDRTPVRYRIEAAVTPGKWRVIASSQDRLPFRKNSPVTGFAGRNLSAEQLQTLQKLLAEMQALEKQMQSLSRQDMVFAGVFRQPGETHRLYRGDPMAPREVVKPDTLTIFGSLSLKVNAPEQKRRVALAKWITSKDNPLTARVMVNRIWHYHFGKGIVPTPSDFGKNGGSPSHPELLDWLAQRFMAEGWSIKKMHRLILLSSVYQQASVNPAARGSIHNPQKVDAGNRLLWHFPQRRLEAEAIRDSILAVSGALNLEMGGPGFSIFKPNNNYVRNYVPKEKLGPEEWRRMIYAHKVRMEKDAVFGAFDCPDAGQAAPRRSRSTTAIQALNLFNSTFILQQSKLFAQRIQREAESDPAKQVKRAFQLALSRSPNPDEARICSQLVRSHGLPALCRVLFNTNEFMFLP